MSAESFAVAGAPRDLGIDQGRAFRAVLQMRYRAQPLRIRALQRLGLGDRRSDRLDRDLTRHFPRQSELVEGLARGAGVPRRWLVEALATEFGSDDPSCDDAAVAVDTSLACGGAQLLRSFAAAPVVRRGRPAGGLASVELTRPWLAATLAGVNEAGLAVAGVTRAWTSERGGCAAPAALLVHDCLSLFDSVDGAVDWCLGRPAAGCATLLVADSCGAALAVEVAGDDRRVVRPKDGLLVEGRGLGDAAASICRSGPPEDAALAGMLGAPAALLDPSGRRLGLFDPRAGSAEWFDATTSRGGTPADSATVDGALGCRG
ncbi:MAG: hypothetical protein ACE5FL_16465 [Myxococcota bacterium]